MFRELLIQPKTVCYLRICVRKTGEMTEREAEYLQPQFLPKTVLVVKNERDRRTVLKALTPKLM